MVDTRCRGRSALGLCATAQRDSDRRTLRQCVQLSLPGFYRLQGSGRLAGGQMDAALVISYFVRISSDCGGGAFSLGGRFITRNDGWEFVDVEINVPVAPVSVEIELALDKNFSGASASGWFDDVYFDLDRRIHRDGFE